MARSTAILTLLAIFAASSAQAQQPRRIAMGDIHYLDTSGEPGEREREHAARVELFESVLMQGLKDGGYEVTRLDCGKPVCSVATVDVETAVSQAQKAGADYLLLGAIQKISTLIGTGRIDLVDVARRKDVVSRVLSFRGDSDDAFRRAADFVARNVRDAKLEPRPRSETGPRPGGALP